MGDSRMRSLVKSLTFWIIGIIILGVIAYLITGSWGETLWINVLFHDLRIPIYYFHERWWERIDWGRIRDD